MASSVYNAGKLAIAKGQIAYLTDTINIALLKSTYTPNLDTDTNFSDIVAQESSGTGYTTKGQALANKTLTQDNTNDRAVFDADDVNWPTSTIADARYAVVFKNTGNNATSQLLAWIDLLATKVTNGDTFQVQFDATGVFYLGQ